MIDGSKTRKSLAAVEVQSPVVIEKRSKWSYFRMSSTKLNSTLCTAQLIKSHERSVQRLALRIPPTESKVRTELYSTIKVVLDNFYLNGHS